MEAITDAVLVAIRKIIRSSDLHSNHMRRRTGLTSPQLLLLKAMQANPDAYVGQLSEQISLSQATVTTVLDRLELDGLAIRERSTIDRRKVHARLTEKGKSALTLAPSPLQLHFVEEFESLKPHERSSILSALQHVAEMMQAPTEASLLALNEESLNGMPVRQPAENTHFANK
ncbi:MAG: MarR family transcriptional regulator [Gammaproteobacteria bacterium]